MKKNEVKICLTEGQLARLNDNVAKTGLSRETYFRLPITRRLMGQFRKIQLCLTN